MDTDKQDLQELINSIKNLTIQIEKNNKITYKKDDKQKAHDFYYYIKRYIQEIIEASIGLIVVIFLLKKKFTLFDFSKIVFIIGFITLILEEYNVEYLNNFKQGIHFTLGSLAFNS